MMWSNYLSTKKECELGVAVITEHFFGSLLVCSTVVARRRSSRRWRRWGCGSWWSVDEDKILVVVARSPPRRLLLLLLLGPRLARGAAQASIAHQIVEGISKITGSWGLKQSDPTLTVVVLITKDSSTSHSVHAMRRYCQKKPPYLRMWLAIAKQSLCKYQWRPTKLNLYLEQWA